MKIKKMELVSKNTDKKITIYPSAVSDRPVIYLNTFAEEESGKVYQALCDSGCADFSLVVINGLDWNHDMAPWDIPPIASNDAPCTKGADEYLQFLIGNVIPKVEQQLPTIAWRGLAGYSLAGLFAVYSMYQTTLFSRIASMSGSLWFPGFKEYVFSQKPMQNPEYLYFSLGNKESRTNNPYLKTVQENTERIAEFYQKQGIETTLCMNVGGHFKDTAKRTAAGIQWLLSKSSFFAH